MDYGASAEEGALMSWHLPQTKCGDIRWGEKTGHRPSGDILQIGILSLEIYFGSESFVCNWGERMH